MNQTLMRTLKEPAIVGGTAAGLSVLLGDGMDSVSTPLGTMPIAVPVAIAVGVASYASEGIKNYVLPDTRDVGALAPLVKPVITGGAASAAIYFATELKSMDTIRTAFLLGGAAEFLGSSMYDSLVKSSLGM